MISLNPWPVTAQTEASRRKRGQGRTCSYLGQWGDQEISFCWRPKETRPVSLGDTGAQEGPMLNLHRELGMTRHPGDASWVFITRGDLSPRPAMLRRMPFLPSPNLRGISYQRKMSPLIPHPPGYRRTCKRQPASPSTLTWEGGASTDTPRGHLHLPGTPVPRTAQDFHVEAAQHGERVAKQRTLSSLVVLSQAFALW